MNSKIFPERVIGEYCATADNGFQVAFRKLCQTPGEKRKRCFLGTLYHEVCRQQPDNDCGPGPLAWERTAWEPCPCWKNGDAACLEGTGSGDE